MMQTFSLILFAWLSSCNARHLHEISSLSSIRVEEVRQQINHIRSTQKVSGRPFLLDKRSTRLSLSYAGQEERLRVALFTFISGQSPFVLALAGGSITAGKGATPEYPSWGVQLFHMLNETFPRPSSSSNNAFTLANGAVEATGSSYMSMCVTEHVPKESNLVILEYSCNDPPLAVPYMNNPDRSAYERLVRKVLKYVLHPAVLIMNFVNVVRDRNDQPGKPLGPPAPYWGSIEGDIHDFALYYGLPAYSVKAGVYHKMQRFEEGFMINTTCAPFCEHISTQKYFYHDAFHPYGPTGHRVMAEIVFGHLLDVIEEMLSVQLNAADIDHANEPLPPPVIPGNFESTTDLCAFKENLRPFVLDSLGWNYTDEGRKKFGWVADLPGSALTLALNTKPRLNSSDVTSTDTVIVNLAMLSSYEHMGRASISCVFGCTCNPVVLDFAIKDHFSPVRLFPFSVSKHNDCHVNITVLNETSSEGHKVKLLGFTIEEDSRIQKTGWNWWMDGALSFHDSGPAEQASLSLGRKHFS